MSNKISLGELSKVKGIGKKTIQRVRQQMIEDGTIEKKSITEVGFPDKEYSVIYADPPWNYDNGHYQDGGREFNNLDNYYEQMTVNEIKKLPVEKISKNNCILFMWVTDSHLLNGAGQEVMKAWGFEPKTIGFNWIKHYESGSRCVNFSPYTLKSWEVCVIGTKGAAGKLKVVNDVQGYLDSIRTIHSKKPDEARKRIERLVGEKEKIELFARQRVDGWDCWGNEV